MDLTQLESGIFHVDRIVKRTGQIIEIEVLPFNNLLYWIEVNQDGGGHLMQSRTDGSNLSPLFSMPDEKNENECTCTENPIIGRVLSVDQTDPFNVAIIYSNEWQDYIYQTEPNGCDCRLMVHSSKLSPTSLTTDHKYLYWSNETEDSVFIYKQNSIETFTLEGVKKIMAVGSHLQPFPPVNCLMAQQVAPIPILLDNSVSSITLQLPQPERNIECKNISLPSVQYIIYFDSITEDGISECNEDILKCKSVMTYQRIVKINDLEPFSTYVFMISLRNYFNFLKEPITGPPIIYSTLAGAPSSPQNVSAKVLTPNVVEVNWLLSPNKSIDKTVSYQVHWRTEGIVAGVRQSGEQIVEKTDRFNNSSFSIIIKKLIPGQTYLIWVRAYSKYSSMYSESEKVEVKTFKKPNNITLERASSYSLEISWIPPKEHVQQYEIQYQVFSSPTATEWKNISPNYDNVYSIENLSPKTLYRFRAKIIYFKSKEPYVWPQERGFVFETLGEQPFLKNRFF